MPPTTVAELIQTNSSPFSSAGEATTTSQKVRTTTTTTTAEEAIIKTRMTAAMEAIMITATQEALHSSEIIITKVDLTFRSRSRLTFKTFLTTRQ